MIKLEASKTKAVQRLLLLTIVGAIAIAAYAVVSSKSPENTTVSKYISNAKDEIVVNELVETDNDLDMISSVDEVNDLYKKGRKIEVVISEDGRTTIKGGELTTGVTQSFYIEKGSEVIVKVISDAEDISMFDVDIRLFEVDDEGEVVKPVSLGDRVVREDGFYKMFISSKYAFEVEVVKEVM